MNGVKTTMVVTATVLLATCRPFAQAAQPAEARLRQERQLTKCEQYIEAGKLTVAYGYLSSLRRTILPEKKPRYDALLCRYHLGRNELEKAFEAVASYEKRRKEYVPLLWDGHYLCGNTLLRLEVFYRAGVLFDWLAANADGLNKVLAAEGCAKSLVGMRQYRKAIDSYHFALKYLRHAVTDEEGRKALEARLRAGLAEARRLYDIYLYGEDFLLYRKAEELRRGHKRYAEARKIYLDIIKRFPEGAYGDAAGLYECLCLLNMKQPREARKRLWAFCRSDEDGLYRGEALLAVGRLDLERYVNRSSASSVFAKLEEWLETIPKKDEFKGRIPKTVKPAAVKLVTPPEEEKKTDFWGNVNRERVAYGQLVNRQTCKWYLDNLREHCCMFRGFLYWARGRMPEAREYYERVLEYDKMARKMQSRGIWNNYRRLMKTTRTGVIEAYPQEMALFKGRAKLAVQLADFYYITEQFGKSIEICRRLLNDEFGKLNAHQRDCPQLRIADALFWTQGRMAAYREYLKVLSPRDGTFSEDQAAYCAGNVSIDIADEKIQARGLELLRRLGFARRRNDFVYMARALYGRRLIEIGRTEEGYRILETFPKEDEGYWELAQYYLKFFRDKEKEMAAEEGGSL